jgi:hypothetical protein
VSNTPNNSNPIANGDTQGLSPLSDLEMTRQYPKEGVFRQITGLFFLLLFFAAIYLTDRLPLGVSIRFIILFAAGLVFFLTGYGLSRGEVITASTVQSMGILLLLTSSIYLALNGIAEGSWLGPGLCVVLLILTAVSLRRAKASMPALALALSLLYLAMRLFPKLLPVHQSFALALAAVFAVTWLFLWRLDRPASFLPSFLLILLYSIFAFFGGDAARQSSFAFVVLTPSLVIIYAVSMFLSLQYTARWKMKGLPFIAVNALGFALTLTLLIPEVPWLGSLILLISGIYTSKIARRYEHLQGLARIYLGQVTLAFAVCIVFILPPGYNWVAASLLCFLPARLGAYHGSRAFYLTEYGLIIAVTTATFLTDKQQWTGAESALFLAPAQLFLLIVILVFIILGRLHHYWDRHQGSENDPYRWFALQQQHQLQAASYFFAVALLLMLHTLWGRNDNESFPVLLGLQAYFFIGAAMVLVDGRLALIGLVPLMAGYLCYYACPYLIPTAFEAAPLPDRATFLFLSSAALILAVLGDHLLAKQSRGKALPSEKLFAMLLYLPLFIPAAWSLWSISFMAFAAAVGILGFAGIVFLGGRRCTLPGLSTWGQGASLSMPLLFLWFFLKIQAPAYSDPFYLPALLIFLILFLIWEAWLVARLSISRGLKNSLSCTGAVSVTVLGSLLLYPWNSGPIFAGSLLLLSVLLGVTGFVKGQRSFYILALVIVTLATLWALTMKVGLSIG